MAAPRDHYVGEWLKQTRLDEGMTRLELAMRIGISEKTCYIWETRGWIPRYAAPAVAIALNRPLYDLPGFDGPEPRDLIDANLLTQIAEVIAQNPAQAAEHVRLLRSLAEQVEHVAAELQGLVEQLEHQTDAEQPSQPAQSPE